MATGTIKKQFVGLTNWTLLNGGVPTTSVSNWDLYGSRKISDFDILYAVACRGDYVRASQIMPRSLFTQGYIFSLTEVDSLNTQRWYEITYVTDTRVKIQKSSSASEACKLYLYGIASANLY